MSHPPEAGSPEEDLQGESWRPTASLDALRLRARIASEIRAFFASRDVLEVETPFLSAATVPDLHLASLSCRYGEGGALYLQTSPEYAMKRLLAAGSGPIFQISKAFRDGEAGSRHNPEFTLLEWYRPGFDHHRLMDEVEELLHRILSPAQLDGRSARRLTYREAFLESLGLDPHSASLPALAAKAETADLDPPPDLGRDDLLNLLISCAVEPALARANPRGITFVHDFPASQAALARTTQDPDGNEVAERFEAYVGGMELANGFHELTDPAEQRRRFEADRAERRRRGMPVPPLDENLLAALEAGMPESAGVALGVDRLVMLAAGASRIDEVIAFPVDRA